MGTECSYHLWCPQGWQSMQSCHHIPLDMRFQHVKELARTHTRRIRETHPTLLPAQEDCATGRACMRPEEMKPFSPKRLLPRMRLWPAALEK